MQHFINPIEDFGADLYAIQKPARYLGGEVGSHPRIAESDQRLKFALCFPDLYEIGMSNNAIRIIYNDLGRMADDVVCERVFTPAPDFEDLLKRRDLPLYTLESGIPLAQCDIVGFSIGYELLATNILTVLETGRIPLLAKERTEKNPLVIGGGPASTNPHPFGAFLDAVYIGEAEAELYAILRDLASMKKAGAGRIEFLERLRASSAFWMPRSASHPEGKRASRAVFSGFSDSMASTAYPIPVIQTVQSHGTVEIMRGCPNGCRFCHAGYYYRPQRVKSIERIEEEVEALVSKGGYREITLASLSSGDYPDIVGLFHHLNDVWKERFVSFQLPSLKVDSFTLPLIAELSEVRKSGLTFAVETPIETWQGAINKTVSFDKIVEILKEAKHYGFKSAKFYFMIGLPVSGKGRGEGEAIVEFLKKIAAAERIALNVNIGTFVPKPHTPYARESQISEKEALETIYFIKDALRPLKFISISYHSPFTSIIEGILSRGDDRVGDIILSAYRKGARLDAWEEHFNKEVWKSVFAETLQATGNDPTIEYLASKSADVPLPWDDVNLFIGKAYYAAEAEKSIHGTLTEACSDDCDHPCGSCNDAFRIVSNNIHVADESAARRRLESPFADPRAESCFRVGKASESTSDDARLSISFNKEKNASFYPLHSISGIFSRAFFILNIPVRYTEGFNPLPRMEFTQPLALGLESSDDVMAVWLHREITIIDESAFISAFNKALPEGISVNAIKIGKMRSEGKNSIGSLYWGSEYHIHLYHAENYHLLYEALLAASEQKLLEFNADPKRNSVIVSLNDAHGGERNITKILRAALSKDAVLEQCHIRRVKSLSLLDNKKVSLIDML